jgi:hypothetical protein
MRGGITKIEVDNDNGATTMITDPPEMISRILKRNQRHFSQVTGTPLMEKPITEWLGACGESHQGIQLTQGNFKLQLGNHATFPERQMMLDALQPFSPPSKPISIQVTNTGYKNFLKKWDKNTSTSPSGKHLGHYKVLLSPGLLQDPPLTDSTEDIIHLKTKMCQLALTHGYIWNRWKAIASVMIKKKPSLFLLEKLQTIHLYKADYNWTLGLIFG